MKCRDPHTCDLSGVTLLLNFKARMFANFELNLFNMIQNCYEMKMSSKRRRNDGYSRQFDQDQQVKVDIFVNISGERTG